MKKNIKLIVLTFIVLFILGVLVKIIFFLPQTKDETYEIYNRDKDMLIDISEYFASIENDVWITKTTSEDEVMLNNTEIFNKVKILQEKYNYGTIAKENKTIFFQTWSVKDWCCGIAYTLDGSEPELKFITNLEKFPEANWYYYEENFHKWKTLNSSTQGTE